MSFIDDLKRKLGFSSSEETDELDEHFDFINDDADEKKEEEEELNNTLKIDYSDDGEVLEGDETPPESEAVSLKSKAVSILIGATAIVAVVFVINSAVSDTPKIEDNRKKEEQSFDIPSVSQSPAAAIPEKYSQIKVEEEKPKEVPQEQTPVIQEVPRIDPNMLQQEREYQENLNRILSSSISFGLNGQNGNNNNGTNTSSVGNVYYPKMVKHFDSYVNGFSLMAGAVIPATMLSGATSDSPNADIVAQVRQDIYDSKTGKHLLIPQGCKLIGVSASAGERGNHRLGIVIKRIVFPNGTTYDLPNYQSIDGPGYPGLKDKYTQHSSTLMRTAVMAAIFAAAAQSATGGTGGTNNYRSAGQEAVSGAAASVLNTAQQIIQRDANLAPTITIRPGFQFNVFINKDIVLKDYKYEPKN